MWTDETFRALRSVPQPHGSRSRYVERRIESARSGVPKTGRCKPAKTRAEAEGQAAFRFPRPCRLDISFRTFFGLLRDQLVIRQPLARDFSAKKFEPICVRHVLSCVVTEHLFVNIPEQVEWFNAHVGAFMPRFSKLQKFSMPLVWTCPFDVSLSMVDDRVGIFVQPS